VHSVDVAHSALLIDLTSTESKLISFTDSTTLDWNDIIALTSSLQYANISYHIDNYRLHGWFTPKMVADLPNLEYDVENFHHLALDVMRNGPPGLLYSPIVPPKARKAGKFGLDEIFLINLLRRPDRVDRMEACFRLLGIVVHTLCSLLLYTYA